MKRKGHLLPEGARKVAGGEARLCEREPPDHAHDIILIRAACRRYARSVLPLQGGSHGGELRCPSGSGRTSPQHHFATHPVINQHTSPSPPHHTSIKSPTAHSFANTFLCRKTALPFRPSTSSPFPLLSIPLPKTNAPIRPHAPSLQVHFRYILVRVSPPWPDRFKHPDL